MEFIDQNNDNCPICLEPLVFEVAEINQQPNPCGHKFCHSCFLNHLKTFHDDQNLHGTMICPLCRRIYVGVSFSDFCYYHPVYYSNLNQRRFPDLHTDESSDESENVSENAETETVIIPLFQDLTEFDENDSSDESEDVSDDSLYVPSDSREEMIDDLYAFIDLTRDSE